MFKNRISFVMIVALITASFLGASIPSFADDKHGGWVELSSFSQAVTRTKNYRDTNPRHFKDKRKYQKEIAVLNKGRALLKQVSRSKTGSVEQVNMNFARLEHTLDQLGANAGAEGPASCMQECDSAYPGIGHGNGINRFFCKGACLRINLCVGAACASTGG